MDFGGGDTNLYAYVQNNPIKRIDPLGLESATVVLNLSPHPDPFSCASIISAAISRQANYQGWINSDKRVHCVVSCEISKQCGGVHIGFAAGVAREFMQLFWQGKTVSWRKGIVDSKRDEDANIHGITCPSNEDCYQRCVAKY